MSRADPRLSVPVKINLARKEKYGPHFDQLKRHLDHMRPENVVGTFNTIVERNSMRMDSLRQMLRHKPKISIFDDARTLHSDSGTKSIDLIITSPPYIGAQKYIRSSSLSLGWLDLAYEHELRPLEKLTIGREHLALPEIKDECVTGIRHADKLLRLIRKRNLLRAHMACVYLTEMRSALRSMHRALRPRGKLIIVTGPNTISGYHFDTPSFIEEIACSVGFSSQFKLIDHIRSRGLMTKRNKTAGLIASELVLSFTRS
jgi:DNA modification methylase